MPVFYDEVRPNGQLWGVQGTIGQAIAEAISRAKRLNQQLWFKFESVTQTIVVQVGPNSNPQLILRDYYRAYYGCILPVVVSNPLSAISPEQYALDLMAAIRYRTQLAGRPEVGLLLDPLVTLRHFSEGRGLQPPADPVQYQDRLHAALLYGGQLADAVG